MLCGILETETTLQIADKTRLSASKSFVSKGEAAITKVEIDPGDGAGFVDVTGVASPLDPNDWYLDWIYSGASRTVTAQVRITTSAAPVIGVTKDIALLTSTDDHLFSSDKDLMALEPDVMKWVPDGRASWLNIHRAAQEKILDWLNKAGVSDANDVPLTKVDVISIDEVRFWSRDWVLGLIFHSVSNVKDDVFDQKAKFYFGEAGKGSNRSKIRLDTNHDGTLSKNEGVNVTSSTLIRA